MNWINVNDRLPEEDELVLAAVTGRDKNENIEWEDAYLLARFYPEEGWCLEDHWETTDFTIRWWMRLPEDVPGGNDVPDTNVGHINADRYHEIMRAEREGRLEIMPCKVGDVLYITEPRFYNYEKHEGVQTGVCKGYEMHPRHGWVIKAALEHGEPATLYFYAFKDFGKTVFLTREEAEKALEEAIKGSKMPLEAIFDLDEQAKHNSAAMQKVIDFVMEDSDGKNH